MVIRSYKCTACHTKFDAYQRPRDEAIRHCPRCEHEQVEELKGGKR